MTSKWPWGLSYSYFGLSFLLKIGSLTPSNEQFRITYCWSHNFTGIPNLSRNWGFLYKKWWPWSNFRNWLGGQIQGYQSVACEKLWNICSHNLFDLYFPMRVIDELRYNVITKNGIFSLALHQLANVLICTYIFIKATSI